MSPASLEGRVVVVTGASSLGRGGHPGELDGAVLFPLGDGSRFVTGQVLGVDGGMAAR
jgi:NAD(P)-dependent dehydrogenase (short-subunit alcohol dehydrogenase family)